jgi:AraC-like DNA-binding protein/mannose-6-phosphate isomerase-like protein (cupin superfamily)
VERLNQHSSDSMSELLRAVKVHSTVYCLSDLGAPWGFHVEDSMVAKFHLVLDGACLLTVDEGEQVAVECGELVLIASGAGHTLQDGPGGGIRSLETILMEHPVDGEARLTYGGSGRRTRLLCGGFALAEALPAGLLALLPGVLRIDAAASGLSRWLEPLFGLLREEAAGSAQGAAAVFTKIADVFLTQTLRTYLIGAQDAGLVQLAPLRDPAVARAVELLTSRPHERWTVAGLAREVGMSRTVFSGRFRDLVGQTPIRYLTGARLGRAAGYLATTNQSLHAIARRTGYDSEASFSKAFKREFGRSPGEYRRQIAAKPVLIGAGADGPPAADAG